MYCRKVEIEAFRSWYVCKHLIRDCFDYSTQMILVQAAPATKHRSIVLSEHKLFSLKLQVRRVLWASWVEFNLLHRWRCSKCPFMIFKNTRSLQRWGNRIRFGANNFWPNQLLSNLPNLAVYSCPMVGQPDWGKGVGWGIVVCPGLTSCQLSHYCPLFGENDPSLLPSEISF